MATYMNQTNSGRIIVQQTSPSAIIVQPDNERKIILKGSGGLKGETGEQGPAGPQGEQGPQGPAGQPGPANTLSIGTVQKGDTAEATITGTAPNQTLNLTLPKGDKGDTGSQGPQGPAATIAVGTTSTLPEGSSATVTNSGTSSAAVFNFGIPKGDKGDTGETGETGPTGPAGPGVVSGGSTGQVLTKKSGTDYDTEWATPAAYSDFTGATSSVAGAHGLVPAPTTSDPDKFLKGDGTWGTPPGTTYTAGEGIEINSNTIAAKVRKVYNHFTSRPASANLTQTGNGGMFTFQATGSMTTAKPKNDAHIIHLEWDNNGGWDSQIAVNNNGSSPWIAVRAQDGGTWKNWVYLLNDTAGSVKTANIDALAVTTAKIADGAITEAKINATDWAKKVDVASIDLTGQTADLLTLTKALGTAGTDYARWTSKTDGGSANISDKPTGSTNKSFVCEAFCSRWASSSDYGYQLICRSRDYTNPYIAYIDQNTSSIVWGRLSPTVNDATLTITQNGSTLGTFSANASSNVTVDVPVTDRDIYSTTEQVIGEWIDGKPVYRVVLSGNISSTTGTYVPTNTYNAATIDVISCTGKLVNDQNQYMQLGCYLNSSNYSGWFMSASAMTIFFPSAYNHGAYTIVIEYTKKTS